MKKTRLLTFSAMCLAMGIILPQAFHMVPNAGNIFLPMHIPVLVCGFICGPLYGLLVGLLTPLISHLIFSMPSTMMLGQMLVELSIYGLCQGILSKVIKIKNQMINIYVILIISMLIGRIAYGLTNALIFKVGSYSLNIWLASAFITSLPGIIIQLLTVPLIINAIRKINNIE